MKRRYFGILETEKNRRRVQRIRNMLFLSALLSLCLCMQVFAAVGDGATIVTSGFNVIYEIIAALVSSCGSLLLLWGLFEWAQSLNTQDGGAQSMAFKRVASGLVATIGPQLVPIITLAVAPAV